MISAARQDIQRRHFSARVTAQERSTQIATLRWEGHTYKDIASKLAINYSTVERLFKESMKKVNTMDPTEIQLYKEAPLPHLPGSTQHEALELRKGGYTFPEIAEQLHISEAIARSHVKLELERLEGVEIRDTDLVRRMQLERLEAILKGLWGLATRGDKDAVNAALKVIAQQATLQGTNAPQRIDVEENIKIIALEIGVPFDELMMDAQQAARELMGRSR